MPIDQTTYKGKKIITVSYEDFQSKELMIESAKRLADYILSQPEDHIRVFMDLNEALGSREFMAASKAARLRVYAEKTTTSAAIGVTGMKKVLLKGYNAISKSKGVVPFDTKEQALEYLISDGEE
ncbi:hypothetical protein SAMN05421640_0392 [Ekhidna lutea]|uniref:SpoIIAA-like n=1 Tax=Ekhidna lutea TaxID=447679 RepID=A0A239EZZ6_EKHLU|nr:hypothetical protein [Ekhidna lutea]SNS49613.1 hypothetical protein SAMN05421640_0392 [Ekhidna lutea]